MVEESGYKDFTSRMNMEIREYEEKARKIRIRIIKMAYSAKASWIGSAMSCVEIITVLFMGYIDKEKLLHSLCDRDKFFLSKGHASSALYAVLAELGAIPEREIETYMKDGTLLAGHSIYNSFPGIESSSGSLGHGISLAVGSALAAKILGYKSHIYALVGDGECNEGSVWEVLPFAVKQQLSNLTIIIDRNKLQSYGSDEEVLQYGDIGAKFKQYGCNVIEIDGNCCQDLVRALDTILVNNTSVPTVIVANTIKGKGVSYMENRLSWHYKSLNEGEYNVALKELGYEKGIDR